MLARAANSSPAAVEEERAASAQDPGKAPMDSPMSRQEQQNDGPSQLPPRPPAVHHHTTAYQPQHSDRIAALLMPASTLGDAAAAAAAAAAGSGSHAHMMAGMREGGAVVPESGLLDGDMPAGISASATHPGAELSSKAPGSRTLKPHRAPAVRQLDMDGGSRAGEASTSAAAGLTDDGERSSHVLASNPGELVPGIRLKPLSLSSRDHRDGWLHMEPSVRQAAAAAVAGTGVARRAVGKAASPGLSATEIPESSELTASPQRRLDSARSSENLESILSPSTRSGTNTPSFGASQAEFAVDHTVLEAWDLLRRSRVLFRGRPVGTIAAMDSSEAALNYDQVFVRDFIPSALAFLMNGEPDIVRNFLLKTLRLQAWEKRVDVFTLGEGVMPASFKVLHDPKRNMDTMVADFGESAIGRVAPVDSGFWWIILLRAYVKATGDTALAESPDCQRGMRLILNLCLADGFDTFPTLLCADGCCMIDRRMGIYGYPIEIQSLFYMALRIARGLLRPDINGNKELLERIDKRLLALSYHMRTYFWLDHEQLNNIYRYKTEEYSHTAVNKFNVIPDSIPDWLFDFMPMKGGYFVGNVSPARMDFRWFAVGNCMAILSSLTTREQACAIMDLIEERWDELMGDMPLKVAYPALENHEWRITTGCDPKNTRWSYHNGGSWPVLLWMLTAASIKVGRPHVARRAIETAEMRLSRDSWPEYYDGKLGRYVGKQARKLQTWSIAGYLVSKMLLEDPSHLGMVALEEERKLQYPTLARSQSWRY